MWNERIYFNILSYAIYLDCTSIRPNFHFSPFVFSRIFLSHIGLSNFLMTVRLWWQIIHYKMSEFCFITHLQTIILLINGFQPFLNSTIVIYFIHLSKMSWKND